jgi:hypothetical protein
VVESRCVSTVVENGCGHCTLTGYNWHSKEKIATDVYIKEQ